METLHLKTPHFEVTNTVYNHIFNLNVELMRYILIKEKLNMSKAQSMLYEAYTRFYNSTIYDFQIRDPFLFLLHKSRKDSQLVESYNQVVKEILKELEIYKFTEEANKKVSQIDGLEILIEQNKDASVTFAIYYHKRKIFFLTVRILRIEC